MLGKLSPNTAPNAAIETNAFMSSAAPKVGRGLRFSTWKVAPNSVPKSIGRSGMSPGFGGGVHPPVAAGPYVGAVGPDAPLAPFADGAPLGAAAPGSASGVPPGEAQPGEVQGESLLTRRMVSHSSRLERTMIGSLGDGAGNDGSGGRR